MKLLAPTTLLTLTALSLPAHAALQLDGKPSITFSAEGHPGALDIEGTSSTVQLAQVADDLVIMVPVKSVTTGIDLRDEHMREKYIQVDQFPNIVLRLPMNALHFPDEKGQTEEGSAEATLSAHGQEAPVVVEWSLKRGKTGWQVRGDFDFDTRALGMEIESYLGVTVDPQMHARARFNLIDDEK